MPWRKARIRARRALLARAASVRAQHALLMEKAALRGCVSHLRKAELCPSPQRLRAVGLLRSWQALSVRPVAAEAAPTGNVIQRRSPERKCASGGPPDRRWQRPLLPPA